MKCQILLSSKNKKTIAILFSVEFAPSKVSVNTMNRIPVHSVNAYLARSKFKQCIST